MGRKKKITVIEDAPESAELEPTPAEAAQLAAEEEQELQEQLQAGEWLTEFQSRFTDQPVKIQVERFDEAGDWALCRKYPLQSFDPDMVRTEYGGGKYRCTLYDPQGKWVKGGRTYFKFADPIVKPVLQTKTENPLENPIFAMMLNAQKESTNMLMTIMQSLLTTQGAVGTAKGSTMTEVIETVKAINGMAPKEKPLDTLKEQLGLFKLVKDITGDSDGESKGGLLSDLKEVIEVLPLLKEHMAALKPAAPAQIAPGKAPEMDPLTKKIVDLIPKFVGGARANASIKEWGNYLLDVFDAEILPLLMPVMKEKYKALVKDEDDCYDVFLRYAKDPDERALALKQIPPLAPYLPWVNQVIDEAIHLAETETDTPQENSAGGNSILEAVSGNGVKIPVENSETKKD